MEENDDAVAPETSTAEEDIPGQEEFLSPSQLPDLSDAIRRAEELLSAAEHRRTQRQKLAALLQELNKRVETFIKEEDQDGATWLRAEINALQDMLGTFRPQPPRPPRPQPKPQPPKPVGTTPKPFSAPELDNKQAVDLHHWQKHWNDLVQLSQEGTMDPTSPTWLFRARATLFGVASSMIRMGGNGTSSKELAVARKLADVIAHTLYGVDGGTVLPNKWQFKTDRPREAARLRGLSDGYFRAAHAATIIARESETPSEALTYRQHCVECAVATLLHHQACLAAADLNDPQVNAVLTAGNELATTLGVPISARPEPDSQPPYTAKYLSSLAEPPTEPTWEETEEPEDDRSLAVKRVMELVTSRTDFGTNADYLAHDREAAADALRKAFAAGVPPSNKEIRDSILDRWHALLDGAEGFDVFLREVDAELERRSLEEQAQAEAVELEEEEPESQNLYAMQLRPLMAGKRILILGGVPRVHTPQRLKAALQCEEVLWPEAKRTDDASKFEAEMRCADVILVVKNYARHAASELAGDVARETGAHRIMLTAGYGVNKILSQMHEYFSQRHMV